MQEDKICKNLLIGVTGSIHAADIYDYIAQLRSSFAENIKVIVTASASRMLNLQVLELYTDDRVFTDFWDRSPSVNRMPHIQLPRWADLLVILPATADIIGKAANGIADDLLSTVIIACNKPIVFVPAMNQSMWNSKAVQRNKRRLEDDGHYVIPPNEGALAVGTGERNAVSPSIDLVLMHVRHIRMKQLRNEYWEEAVKEKPLTPMEKTKIDLEKKRQQIIERRERENSTSIV